MLCNEKGRGKKLRVVRNLPKKERNANREVHERRKILKTINSEKKKKKGFSWGRKHKKSSLRDLGNLAWETGMKGERQVSSLTRKRRKRKDDLPVREGEDESLKEFGSFTAMSKGKTGLSRGGKVAGGKGRRRRQFVSKRGAPRGRRKPRGGRGRVGFKMTKKEKEELLANLLKKQGTHVRAVVTR